MISAIVITYNRKELLIDCIISLNNQNYIKQKYEIIIVDDGSNDGTEEIIRQLQLKIKNLVYIKQVHKGYAFARNLGIKTAKGEIIAFTDDDCIPDKNWIERIDISHKKNKNISVIGGKTIRLLPNNIYNIFREYFDEYTINCRIEFLSKLRDIPPNDNILYSLPTSNLSFKRDIFSKIGYFEIKHFFYSAEDEEINWRLFKKGYYILYDPTIIVKHLYPSNLNRFIKRAYRDGIGTAIIKKKWKDYPSNIPNNLKGTVFFMGGLFLIPIFEIAHMKKMNLYFIPLLYIYELYFRLGIIFGMLQT